MIPCRGYNCRVGGVTSSSAASPSGLLHRSSSNKYNSSASSSARTTSVPFEAEYFGGLKVRGSITTDVVRVNNFVFDGLEFGEATDKVHEQYRMKYDGVLGMSPWHSAQAEKSSTPEPPMAKAMFSPRNAFSFYIHKDDERIGRHHDYGGELFLGGSNPDFYHPPMVYAPVVKNADMWSVRVDGIVVGDVQLCPGNCFAMIDTGAYHIHGPSEDVKELNRIIGAKENDNRPHRSLYFYEMGCDVGSMSNATDVKFVIGGHEFVLNPEDYVEETGFSETCFSLFQPTNPAWTSLNVDWILGATFLAKYYTEFDIEHQRIGFALAKERRVTLATELVDGGGDKDDEEEAEITAEIRDDIPKKVDSSREHHTSGQLVVVSVFGTIGVVILLAALAIAYKEASKTTSLLSALKSWNCCSRADRHLQQAENWVRSQREVQRYTTSSWGSDGRVRITG